MNVPVLVGVTSKWFGWPGMTSRLNSNGTIQNEWMTSVEVRLNRTVSLVGITSSGSPWLPGLAVDGDVPGHRPGHLVLRVLELPAPLVAGHVDDHVRVRREPVDEVL